MLRRYELTDEEWLRIEPLLPPENTGKQGRPRKDNRIIMNGIVWLARSGAPWRDLPERYGSWKTVYSRFRKWIDDGILDNIFRILSLEAELEELSIDASIIQAHQHSAGGDFTGKPGDCDPYPDDERYPFAESEQFRSDRTLRGAETAQF